MKNKIAVIGLGYVGLPLSVEFSKSYKTVGFDIDEIRISELNKGIDKTLELSKKDIKSAIKTSQLLLTSKVRDIENSNIYIITVPTPINKDNTPNLKFLINASKMIGSILKVDDIVIYESTVFPGCTEEVCVPELEKSSKLKFNKDFYCGYSPERINPGDKINTLTKIKKVTSGSNDYSAKKIDNLYKSIINAGTHLAPNIKVAEASKAIENAQRDINISFVNELALIFDKIGIDTNDVLDAAGTKWNFLKYKPGLVGGHCISVDPYYLVYKSKSLGYIPKVISSGREVNNEIPKFIVSKTINSMLEKQIRIKNANVLILGVTFKENCPDTRNSKVIDIYKEFLFQGLNVDIYDPVANQKKVKNNFNIELIKSSYKKKYDVIILAVSHNEFRKLNIKKIKKNISIVFDLKSFLDRKEVDLRL